MEKLINDFSVGLFFWQTLLFIVLVLFLRKYAWGPILTAVESREEGIKESLEAAKKAKEEMEMLSADNERIIAEAKVERDALLKEGQEIKKEIITEAKEQAKIESEKILLQTKEQINNEKMKAITELKNQVGNISIGIAEKILKTELSDKEKHNELIKKALDNSELN